MAEEKRKILVLVEGAKTDVALMERLLSVYQIDIKYEIISYCTNIYTLYREMFEDKGIHFPKTHNLHLPIPIESKKQIDRLPHLLSGLHII